MDKHATFLKNFLRLCGHSVKKKANVTKKAAFKRELLDKFNINIENMLILDRELAMVRA